MTDNRKRQDQEAIMDFLEWVATEENMGLAHPGQQDPYVPTIATDLDVIEGLVTDYLEQQ